MATIRLLANDSNAVGQFLLGSYLSEEGERTLALAQDGDAWFLELRGVEGEIVAKIPSRLAAIRDAAEGMTVHLAGASALCSVSLAHGEVCFEITIGRDSSPLRFVYSQAHLRQLIAEDTSQQTT